MTVVEDIVASNGPMPVSESPLSGWGSYEDVEERFEDHDALNLFWPRRSTPQTFQGQTSFRPTTNHTKIIYHDDAPRTAVVGAYLDANPLLIERSNLRAIHWVIARCYPDFKTASREVLQTRYPEQWDDEMGGNDHDAPA